VTAAAVIAATGSADGQTPGTTAGSCTLFLKFMKVSQFWKSFPKSGKNWGKVVKSGGNEQKS
jgi:hypothetical protein